MFLGLSWYFILMDFYLYSFLWLDLRMFLLFSEGA